MTNFPIARVRTAAGAFTIGLAAFAGLTRAESIQFPADIGFANVKDFGAKGDGVTDDVAAIKNAIATTFPHNDGGNVNNFKTLYFPNGTYLVSDEISWERWTNLQGQSRDSTVIRLKDNCAGYGAGVSRPVLHCYYNNNMTFDNCVYNLTVNTGTGNPGAVAFRYNNHNGGTVRDVLLKSGDGRGRFGLDLTENEFGPALLKNITVDGFDTGVVTVASVSHATFVNLTLKNQRRVGFLNNLPVAILNLTSANTVPAVINSNFALAHLVLVNATLSGGAGTACAIDNRGTIYLRGIASSGYAAALRDSGVQRPGAAIDEYITGEVISAFPSPRRHLRLPIEEPPDIFVEPAANWVTPAENTGDDAAAIQAAIDGGAKTIYFHSGHAYTIRSIIHVRGAVCRIVGMFSNNGGINADPASFPSGSAVVRFDGTGTDPVTIDGWAPGMYPYSDRAGFEIATNQTLYFRRSTPGMLFIRTTPQATGKVFFEDTHADLRVNGPTHIWMRHFNDENNPYDPANPGDRANREYVINNGGYLWILGMKTEAPALHIETTGGGKSELLGAFFRDHFYNTIPYFKTTESSVSATYLEYDYDGQHARGLQAIETRGGVTKQIDLGHGGHVIGLYSGFDSTSNSTVDSRAPVIGAPRVTGKLDKFDARGRLVAPGAANGAVHAAAGACFGKPRGFWRTIRKMLRID